MSGQIDRDRQIIDKWKRWGCSSVEKPWIQSCVPQNQTKYKSTKYKVYIVYIFGMNE